jgi:hypothetical protein
MTINKFEATVNETMVFNDKENCRAESYLEYGDKVRPKLYDDVTLHKKDIIRGFRQYKNELKKMDLHTDVERVEALIDMLGDADTGYDDLIYKHITTLHYADYHGEKRKQSLSEFDTFSRGLTTLADEIIKISPNKTWLSQDAIERIGKREISVNQKSDEGIDIDLLDHLDTNNLKENEKMILLKRLSEEMKRKQRNITDEDLYKYPELLEMQASIILLKDELGLDLDGEEKENKRREYILKQDEKLLKAQKEAYLSWGNGKPRKELHNLKPNELDVNSVLSPVTDEIELNKKWEELLSFYGMKSNGVSQFERLKEVINDINYEMFVVKEQLRRPINCNEGKDDTVNHVDSVIDLSNIKHIKALLGFQTEQKKVNNGYKIDENGNKVQKQKRFTLYHPIYAMLKDKYADKMDSYIFLTLMEFETALKNANLTEMERDIVDVVMQNKGYEGLKNTYKNHPYERAVAYIEEVYNVKKETRNITYALENTIAKKIHEAYLIEINKTAGTLKRKKRK